MSKSTDRLPIRCRLFGHKVDKYKRLRAAMSPVAVTGMGCKRCHTVVPL